MTGRAQCPRLVPGLPGRNDIKAVQSELRQRRLRQRHVRIVGRVKCTAKHANALGSWGWWRIQTQSRLIKNSLYKRSSGEPAST